MVVNDPTERVVIIEDTGEIQCAAPNHVQYHTSSAVNMRALLKTTLRMRPDRILVGEVRGPEALNLLMAWNTGHEGGAATLHANNARAGLDRLALLISMHPGFAEAHRAADRRGGAGGDSYRPHRRWPARPGYPRGGVRQGQYITKSL